jgi:hypothetical protein
MRPILPALAAAVVAVSFAAAQTEPAPACQEAVFRQFDFWVGDWDVFDQGGKLAGTNSITAEEEGCLLVERWKGASGTTGQSYNYVDRQTGKWRQIWVSKDATIDYAGGLNDKGQMVLEGTIAYPGGKAAPFKGIWTANPDGTVTQHFEEYDAGKKSWGEWFTGIYKRRKSEG